MNGIRIGRCAGPRGAAHCLGAGIAMLVSTLAVYAQHPHATQHPHVGCPHGHGYLPPNVGCPHGHGHLPGHHGHHGQYGSTPFPYEAPTYNDYQHGMHDFEIRPPADLGALPSQIRQIKRIEEKVNQEALRIQAYQRKLQQRIRAQTSWGTRGAGRDLSGPNASLGGRRSFEPGAHGGAQKRLARAIQVDADEPSNYFVLAQALFTTQQDRRAARMIKYGLRLAPDWLQAGRDPQRLHKDVGELPAPFASLTKRLQDESQDRDALDGRDSEVDQTGRKEQSPRRDP